MRLLAVLFWWLLFLGMAHAQPSRNEAAAELIVRTEAGCDDRLKLERRVTAILGRPWALPLPLGRDTEGRERGLVVEVRFGRDGDELVAEVTVSGPKPGHRELRDAGPSCEALNGGVAVAIALLLDSAEAAPPEPTQTDAPAPAAAPRETSSLETPPTHSTPPDSRSWHARASVAVAGSYGLGGTSTWLGLGRVGARYGRWVLDVGVGASLPSQESFDGGRVRTSLWFGSARGCYWVGQRLALGPCAQLGIGRLRGQGSGYGEAREANLLWTAASLGLGAELPLGAGVAATFEASVWLPLERHSFSVENRGIAWDSTPIAGLLGAGLTLRAF